MEDQIHLTLHLGPLRPTWRRPNLLEVLNPFVTTNWIESSASTIIAFYPSVMFLPMLKVPLNNRHLNSTLVPLAIWPPLHRPAVSLSTLSKLPNSENSLPLAFFLLPASSHGPSTTLMKLFSIRAHPNTRRPTDYCSNASCFGTLLRPLLTLSTISSIFEDRTSSWKISLG